MKLQQLQQNFYIYIYIYVKLGSKNQSLVRKLCFEKTAVEMHYGGT